MVYIRQSFSIFYPAFLRSLSIECTGNVVIALLNIDKQELITILSTCLSCLRYAKIESSPKFISAAQLENSNIGPNYRVSAFHATV